MLMYEGIEPDAQFLVDLMYAPAYTRICITAIELDVFSKLAEAKTAAELAEPLGWHVNNTGFFLDALTGLGLLKKEDEYYQLTASSSKYLLRGAPEFMGDFMHMYVAMNSYEQTDLAALVCEGPSAAKEEAMTNVSFAEHFAEMRRAQSGARSYETVRILKTVPEYASAKKLLDLGGGSGMLGIAAAQDNQKLQVIIFDTPMMEAMCSRKH